MMMSMSMFTCTAQLNSMHVDSKMIAAFGDDDEKKGEVGEGEGTVRRGVRKGPW